MVYVGEDQKRYVIRVSILGDPLFRALLDEAREVYDFRAEQRLCLPCDENIFIDVVRCASGSTRREQQRICGLSCL